MYLWVTVKDTGCGLTSKQQANLFTRFGQASPKTHVQYGGESVHQEAMRSGPRNMSQTSLTERTD